jgi:mRNA interferase MazF
MPRKGHSDGTGPFIRLARSASIEDVMDVLADGAEIQKTRPAIIVSSDAVGILPIKLVAPIIDWKDRYTQSFLHVRIDPDQANGLAKPSSVDTLQLRGVDISRFVDKMGRVSADKMEEIAAAIAAVVEYE